MNEINIIKYYYLREILFYTVSNRDILTLSNNDFKEFNNLFDKIKKYINENYNSFCDLILNNLITEIDIYNKVIDIQGSILKNINKYPFFLFLNELLTKITKNVLTELYDIKNRYNYGLINVPIILPNNLENNYSFLNNESNKLNDGYVFLNNNEKNLETKKSSFLSGFFESPSKSQSVSNKSTMDRLNFSKDINLLSQEISLLSLKEKHIDKVNKTFNYDEEDKKINLSDLNDNINELLLILNNSSENYDILKDINKIRSEIERIKNMIDASKTLKQGNNIISENLLELSLEDFNYNVNKSRLSLEHEDWQTTLNSIEMIIKLMTGNTELIPDIPINIKTTCEEIISLLLKIKNEEKEIQEFEQKKETINKNTYDKLLKKKKLDLRISNKRLKNSLRKEKNITKIFLKDINNSLKKNKDNKISTYEKGIQLLQKLFKSDKKETVTNNKEKVTSNEVKIIESTLNLNTSSDDLLNKLLEKLKNDRNNDELRLYLENYVNNSKKISEDANISQLQEKTLITNMKSSSTDASIKASSILQEKDVMIPERMKVMMEDTIKMSKILKELVDKIPSSTTTTTNKSDNKNYKDLLEKMETLNTKIPDIEMDDENYKKNLEESDILIKSILGTLEEIDNIDNISTNNEELQNLLKQFESFVENINFIINNNIKQFNNLGNLEKQKDNVLFANIIQKDDLFMNFFKGFN